MLNVLVIGVGGNVSQGVLKALALCRFALNIIVAGVDPMDYGLHTGYRAYICPWANHPQFMGWLVDTCKKEEIHAILTGAEPVVNFLSEHQAKIEHSTGAVVIASTPDVIAIGDDKLKTCEWLEANGFPCPAYAVSEDAAALRALAFQFGYPLVAKPRTGGGSRGLFLVQNDADLAYAATREHYIVQQTVGERNTEYTVGCFSDRDGAVQGVISLQRELHEGTTYRAVAGDYPLVDEAARGIAAALKPKGPCNIQCRIHDGKVYCFEINVRFSGTTPIRARLGFNEVEASLRHFVQGEAVTLPRITQGILVRYINENYIEPEAIEILRRDGVLLNPQDYIGRHEDFGVSS